MQCLKCVTTIFIAPNYYVRSAYLSQILWCKKYLFFCCQCPLTTTLNKKLNFEMWQHLTLIAYFPLYILIYLRFLKFQHFSAAKNRTTLVAIRPCYSNTVCTSICYRIIILKGLLKVYWSSIMRLTINLLQQRCNNLKPV